MGQGKPDEAAACYQQALRLKPDYAEAHNNLGNVFKEKGPDQAAACYQRALQLKPDYALANYNLGLVYQDCESLDEAVACYRQALRWQPDYAEAHNNLGNALKDQGALDEAIASFRRAIELKPDVPEAHSNLLYTLIFSPGYDAQHILSENRRWNQRYVEPLSCDIQPHSNDRLFSSPACESAMFRPIFATMPSRFSWPPSLPHMITRTSRFTAMQMSLVLTKSPRGSVRLADVWRSIAGLSDEQVAQLVRQDRIDILVDLTMHMAGNRLLVFARKPAPVQVTGLPIQGTTGLSTIDYRLTDPYIDPPGLHDHDYSEESIRLPNAFWCYDPLAGEPARQRLARQDNGFITFGCLNNFCKVND